MVRIRGAVDRRGIRALADWVSVKIAQLVDLHWFTMTRFAGDRLGLPVFPRFAAQTVAWAKLLRAPKKSDLRLGRDPRWAKQRCDTATRVHVVGRCVLATSPGQIQLYAKKADTKSNFPRGMNAKKIDFLAGIRRVAPFRANELTF
jgi:hypothetical protein